MIFLKGKVYTFGRIFEKFLSSQITDLVMGNSLGVSKLLSSVRLKAISVVEFASEKSGGKFSPRRIWRSEKF